MSTKYERLEDIASTKYVEEGFDEPWTPPVPVDDEEEPDDDLYEDYRRDIELDLRG